MKLKEKFIEPTKVPNIKGIWVEDLDAAKQCEKIADDYAIEFAEWTDYLGYVLVDNGWVSFSDDNPKNTQELLEIFKKEKGL